MPRGKEILRFHRAVEVSALDTSRRTLGRMRYLL